MTTTNMEVVIKVAGAEKVAFASFRKAGNAHGTAQKKFDSLADAVSECEALCAKNGLKIEWLPYNSNVDTLIGTYSVTK